ncbi:MAG TPA: ABC transporter permease [Vicinamibacterales bacterium]
MRGLFHLTWLEVKIFLREPLGAIGSVVIPVVMYVVLGRAVGPRLPQVSRATSQFVNIDIPVFAALLILLSAIVSLTTIIAIYREGGILKRLRATPLRPVTILTAHVLVKLLFTAVTLLLMLIAGRRYFPSGVHIPIVSFSAALLIATLSTLSIGFVVASIIPTARFAQPAAAVILYPMIAVSGLFFPISALPPVSRAIASVLPFAFVTSLLEGILKGDAWSAHRGDIVALAIVFAVCTAVSARVFRWE